MRLVHYKILTALFTIIRFLLNVSQSHPGSVRKARVDTCYSIVHLFYSVNLKILKLKEEALIFLHL